jgi:hypothetical protein
MTMSHPPAAMKVVVRVPGDVRKVPMRKSLTFVRFPDVIVV